MASRSRIIIADDHALVAEECFNHLEPEFEVVGVVSDGRELLQASNELRPDVVILDLAMPNLNGFLCAELIRRRLPAVKLVFVTVCSSPQVAAEAFRRGASGYLVKQDLQSDLAIAVRRVLEESLFSQVALAEKLCRLRPKHSLQSRVSGLWKPTVSR